MNNTKRQVYLKRLERFLQQTKWALDSQKLYFIQLIHKVESTIDVLNKFVESINLHKQYIPNYKSYPTRCYTQINKLNSILQELRKRYYSIEADLFEYQQCINLFHMQLSFKKTDTIRCVISNHCEENVSIKSFEFPHKKKFYHFQQPTNLLPNKQSLYTLHTIKPYQNDFFDVHPTFVKVLTPETYLIGDGSNQNIKVIKMTSTLSPIVSNMFEKSNSLQMPTDIKEEQKYYYSTDKGSNSVTFYDKSLRKVSDFGGYGDRNGKFNEPTSIDTFNERVFVADALNHRIQVFDLKGRYETSIQGTFSYPHCVRVNDYNQLIVVDNWKSKVELYDIKTGKLTGTIGNSCSNDSFHRPTHVVSRKNEIWVSDTGNGKIEHFIDGIYVNELKLDKIGIDNKPLGIDLMNDEIVVTFVNKNTDVCFISLNEFQ